MTASQPDRLILDRTGFPMIWVECLRAHIHFLPVTKIQFEYFLCDCEESRYDSDFYLKMLEKNPRETPGQLTPDTYCRAFATGVSPDASQAFMRWSGEERDERTTRRQKRVVRCIRRIEAPFRHQARRYPEAETDRPRQNSLYSGE